MGSTSPPSGSTASDLSLSLASKLKTPSSIELAANFLYEQLLDEVVLGVAFEIHRNAKTGVLPLLEIPHSTSSSPSKTSSSNYATDVFGSVVQTSSGVPALKKQPECVCPNCHRNMAALRFAPHLEKCMGMGRNSSRLASRRIANKAGGDGGAGEDDNDAAGDEDWIEPGSSSGRSSHHHHQHHDAQLYQGPGRRKRDKNSPRRNKGGRSKGGGNGGHSSASEPTSHEGSVGTITPPTDFDLLTLEERSYWLSNVCGVLSVTSRKICSRSTRCPVHSDAQRREVRIKWLGGGASHHSDVAEDTHVDIDSFTEGDTAALRESLSQLSGASSPAESIVSTTSSNPSSITNPRGGASQRGGDGKRRNNRGKKGKGSKGGSRGSTPPLLLE